MMEQRLLDALKSAIYITKQTATSDILTDEEVDKAIEMCPSWREEVKAKREKNKDDNKNKDKHDNKDYLTKEEFYILLSKAMGIEVESLKILLNTKDGEE